MEISEHERGVCIQQLNKEILENLIACDVERRVIATYMHVSGPTALLPLVDTPC